MVVLGGAGARRARSRLAPPREPRGSRSFGQARSARTPLSLDGVTTAAVALEGSRRQRRGQIYVALAAVAWSTAGVLQRQLTLDTPTQVFGRAVFAGVALLAYVAVVDRGRVRGGVPVGRARGRRRGAVRRDRLGQLHRRAEPRRAWRASCSSWPSLPMLAALLARVTLGEPITRRTVVGHGARAGRRRA